MTELSWQLLRLYRSLNNPNGLLDTYIIHTSHRRRITPLPPLVVQRRRDVADWPSGEIWTANGPALIDAHNWLETAMFILRHVAVRAIKSLICFLLYPIPPHPSSFQISTRAAAVQLWDFSIRSTLTETERLPFLIVVIFQKKTSWFPNSDHALLLSFTSLYLEYQVFTTVGHWQFDLSRDGA